MKICFTKSQLTDIWNKAHGKIGKAIGKAAGGAAFVYGVKKGSKKSSDKSAPFGRTLPDKRK